MLCSADCPSSRNSSIPRAGAQMDSDDGTEDVVDRLADYDGISKGLLVQDERGGCLPDCLMA